jgi:hypothetical protein
LRIERDDFGLGAAEVDPQANAIAGHGFPFPPPRLARCERICVRSM